MTNRTRSRLFPAVLLVGLGAPGCGLILGLGDFSEVAPGAGGAGGGTGGMAATSAGGGGAATCSDGLKNASETDVDCGGACAPDQVCGDGHGCATGADCLSHVCSPGGTCAAPSCVDGAQNGPETDLDCGGACPKCGPGKTCKEAGDCKGAACTGGKCDSTCTDGAMGGIETDVDCGGSSGCQACAIDKACITSADCQSGLCYATACKESHVWSKRFGSMLNPSVAPDLSGGVVVAGTVKSGSVDFGGGALPDLGAGDPVLARFDATGKHLWSTHFGDSAVQRVDGVSVSAAGGVVVTGNYSGSLNIFSSPAGFGNLFFAKIDMFGVPQWAKGFPNSGSYQEGIGVAQGAAGAIAVIGMFGGSPDFGGGPLVGVASSYNIFVAGFSAVGAHTWSKACGGDGENSVGGITTDPTGGFAVTGSYYGNSDFGCGASTAVQEMDVFVAKLDGAGKCLWSKSIASSTGDADFGKGVAADSSGNVAVVGVTDGVADFGGGALALPGAFVVKYDKAGKHTWSKSFGNNAVSRRVAFDAAGDLYVVGDLFGPSDFGGGPIASGATGMFVVKLDVAGKHLWSRAFVGGSGDVAAVGMKSIMITGATGSGSVDFGGGPLAAQSMSDIYLAKLLTP